MARRVTTMLCRRSVVLVMLVCGATSALSAAPREESRAVSIRIHDYARIAGPQLQQAERQVTDIYARIGVRLEWRAVVRPAEVASGGAEWPTDGRTALTVVVLGRDLGIGVHLPEAVAGYAPITRENGGRIAYVFGDRTRIIAHEGRVDHQDVLAAVIAHEVAHLLIPERSHSRRGMMRAHWAPSEFRNIRMARFTEDEGSSIRQKVLAMVGGPTRVAD
jgi:Zn-dependent protease with chaperone function